jgi:hypothetical protein
MRKRIRLIWFIALIPLALTACPTPLKPALPTPTITKPANNSSSLVGPNLNNKGVDLEATVECGSYPCDSIEWSSNLEGALGSGLTINRVFTKVGTHTVTVTAKSIAGSVSKSVTLNITDTTPQVTITSPTASTQVVQGLVMQLSGTAGGNDGSGFANQNLCVKSSAATWTSDNAADTQFPLKGCLTSTTFTTSSSRTLTLSVVDAFGTPGQASITITPSVQAQLAVSILKPANNGSASVNAGDQVTLEKAVINGVAPISRVWTWQPSKPGCAVQTVTVKPAIVILPGTNPDGYWDLTPQVNILPSGCGWGDGTLTVTVTDKNNQTASASVNFRVDYAPPPN